MAKSEIEDTGKGRKELKRSLSRSLSRGGSEEDGARPQRISLLTRMMTERSSEFYPADHRGSNAVSIERLRELNPNPQQQRSQLAEGIKMLRYRFFAPRKRMVVQQRNSVSESQLKFRRSLKRYLATSAIGFAIDFFNITLSMFSCILYVWETYNRDQKDLFETIDVFFSVFFLMDYLLRLYLSDQRVKFVFSLMAMIDLITIVPAFVTLFDSNELEDAVRVVRVLRILRIVRINRFIISTIDSEINRHVTMLITTVITAGFFCAGLVQIFEETHRVQHMVDPLEFHECLYFVVVTISTVGYGDIAPMSNLSRLVVALLICTALIYIPKSTNHLVTLMSSKSIYARRVFRPPPQTPFVLVCGSIDVVSTRAFLSELFHEDHGSVDLHAVLLCDAPPSAAMENLLSLPEFQLNVTYLQGSPLDVNDLFRCNAVNASGCFLLCNKFTSDPDTEDAGTILRALSIKRFFLQARGEDILTCFQLMREENKQHFTLSHEIMIKDLMQAAASPFPAHENSDPQLGQQAQKYKAAFDNRRKNMKQSMAAMVVPMESVQALSNNAAAESENQSILENVSPERSIEARIDPIICVNQIKMNLLAQACLCPGIITMFANLVMSVDAPPEDGGDEGGPPEPGSATWLQEYHYGSEFEIYRTGLSAVFEGVPFAEASALVHEHKGILMFALELSVGEFSRVIMNPGDYCIPRMDEYGVKCFVMATDMETADLSKIAAPVMKVDQGSRYMGKSSKSSKATGGVSSTEALRKDLEALKLKYENKKKEEKTLALIPNLTNPFQKPKFTAIVGKESTSTAAGGAGGKARHWSLVKSNLTSKPVSESLCQPEDNEEELAQEAEKQTYYILDTGVPLKDVTVNSSLRKDFPGVKDHVVICGNLSGLVNLVKTLRAKHLANIIPIVLLSPTAPSPSLWVQISVFPLIFYVQGSSTDRLDLKRAGIQFASRAIVLAKAMGTKDTQNNDSTMWDAHAIFAHQGAIGLNPKIQIVTELINLSNVGFLDIGGDKGPGNAILKNSNQKVITADRLSEKYTDALQYITGVVFSSSMLDTLISQSFYNPHITTVFQQLISGERSHKDSELKKLLKNGKFVTDEAEAVYSKMQTVNEIEQSFLFQIPVSREFHAKTYGEVFKSLVSEYNMIPLGLLRSTQSPLSRLHKGNITPYVYTNPPKQTLLAKGDRIFLLSRTAPNSKLAGKSVADVIAEMSVLSKQSKLHKKIGSTSSGAPTHSSNNASDVSSLNEEIASLKNELMEVKELIKSMAKQKNPVDSHAEREINKGQERQRVKEEEEEKNESGDVDELDDLRDFAELLSATKKL